MIMHHPLVRLRSRRPRLWFALSAGASVVFGLLAAAPGAHAQGPAVCNPPCATGQLCWQGTCMVPAPRPNTAPPPAAPAPAPGSLPGYPYRPPGAAAPAQPGNYPAPAPAQQPPPGYAPAPPGAYPQPYPPPPPGAYPPPAGVYPSAYPPPPPGYAPAPGYPPPGAQPGYPPGAYQQAPEAPRRRRLLLLPYLGIHSLQGDTAKNLGVGFRTGAVIGFQLNEHVSLDGELLFDIANPKNVPAGSDITAVALTFSFSPFFHLPLGAMEFVAGPKVGLTGSAASNRIGNTKYEQTGSYLTIGTNVGLFFRLGDKLAIGGLVNFDLQSPVEYCTKVNELESSKSCTKDNLGDAEKVFGTAAAILF